MTGEWIARNLLLALVGRGAPALSAEHWRFETHRSTETPAAWIYDPLSGRSWTNQTAYHAGAHEADQPLSVPVDLPEGGSFTLEAYVYIDHDPRRRSVALSLGPHGLGARFLPRWNQTYWAGFSGATRERHATYLINRGGSVWVFGMKTESLGVHAETTDGGRTEI
ncbi:MAG: hypothetical protein AAF492_27595, partial [Verrucomicrobiota bacterium]